MVFQMKFFRKLRQTPELREVVAYGLLRCFLSDRFQEACNSKDADILLDELNFLYHYPESAFPIMLRPLPAVLVTMVREQIPTLKEFLTSEDIFPKIRISTTRGR